MTERKLATIRKISDIQPIYNADAIEVATVDGWKVVVKKGEFEVGDLALYLEIDSWVPTELAPFLSKGKEPREYKGVKGERLKTVKLKGQISQGLLLPLESLPEDVADFCQEFNWHNPEGCDITEKLNILKWEQEIPAQLAGRVKGNFPSFIPKTDQERIQNCIRAVQDEGPCEWELTEKLDGSSMTVFVTNDHFGVCSRNLELDTDDLDNAFVATATKLNLFSKLGNGRQIALQGELIGPGIQKNSYNFTELKYFVYDIYDIDHQRYFLPEERQQFCLSHRIDHVPVLGPYITDTTTTVNELLMMASGPSLLNLKTTREGFVFKHTKKHDVSFKAISNQWLLKND